MAEKRFEVPGRPGLAYDDVGDPDGPPVVLMHGGSDSRKTWVDVAPRLAHDYRVLALDRRGHGDSDWTPGGEYALEHSAADLVAFIEEVVGGAVTLVGHSAGGITAMHVAVTRPDLVDKVFIEDVWLVPEGSPRANPDVRFEAQPFREKVVGLLDGGATSAELMMTAFAEWGRTGDFFRPQQELMLTLQERGMSVEEIAATLGDAPSPLGEGTLADLFSESARRQYVAGLLACDPAIFDFEGKWAAYDPTRPMSCPVHLLRADPALGPPPIGASFLPEHEGSFLATHPRATVEFVRGAGHRIHPQQPDRFTTALLKFLETT